MGLGGANANGHAAAEPGHVSGGPGRWPGTQLFLPAKKPSPANKGKEELPARMGAGHPDGALTPARTWSCFLGSGTDHAESPALIKSKFESSTNR